MRFNGERPGHELTYSDVFLVPNRSAVHSRMDASLAAGGPARLNIPLVAANMTSVTGARMAASLARRGGIAVLPQDLQPSVADQAIRSVKAAPVHLDSAVQLPGTATAAEALALLVPGPDNGVLLVDADGACLGVVPGDRLATALPEAPLADLVVAVPALDADELTDGRSAFDALDAAGVAFAPVRRHGQVIGALSQRSALRATLYQPALDSQGRLRIAAAVGINGDPTARAKALVEAGVDLLVLDTAHGHQENMIAAVRRVADLGLGVPIVAGNVVTADGVRDLVEAGADIIKVGVGPGAMCTTRMMTAVGRPQFTAVMETAEAARALGREVWADGGVRHPRDVALALAAGAHAVMIGSWFAGTVESPGPLQRDERGRAYKSSWGMASTRAVQQRSERLSAYERARRALFAEGISDSRVFLDPDRPSVEDLIDMITTGVRSSMSYAGATTLDEFHERAVVGLQSAAGYDEGKPLPVW